MKIKGKFAGQLDVELEFSARDQAYRVTVWEWRQPYARKEPGWFNPVLHHAYDDWKGFGDKVFDHRKAWKRREQAIRYFSRVKAEQAYRHAQQQAVSEAEESWGVIAR